MRGGGGLEFRRSAPGRRHSIPVERGVVARVGPWLQGCAACVRPRGVIAGQRRASVKNVITSCPLAPLLRIVSLLGRRHDPPLRQTAVSAYSNERLVTGQLRRPPWPRLGFRPPPAPFGGTPFFLLFWTRLPENKYRRASKFTIRRGLFEQSLGLAGVAALPRW